MHSLPFQVVLASLGLLSQVVAFPSPSFGSSPSIHWSNCTGQANPDLDCGTIQVPVDYDKPDGEKIDLFIARLKAKASSRLGSLVYNPGGPGDPTSMEVFFAAQALLNNKTTIFSPELLKHYDIIGLDPRGVGRSSPIKCDPNIFNQRVSVSPKTEEQFNQLIEYTKALGESCKQMTGSILGHVDTVHVAKDIELVRQALNESKVNYLGLSYGTLMGTSYAELYPENVGRMVLDGIMDHSGSEISAIASESVTFEMTLNKYFQWSSKTTNHALHGKDAAAIFDSVIEAASTKPIAVPSCPEGVTPCRNDTNAEEILIAVKNLLGNEDTWPSLSTALDEASRGDASLFATPIVTSSEHPFFSALAIGAQEWTQSSKTFADFVLKEQLIQTLAPHTRGISQTWSLLTKGMNWPAPVTNPQHTLNDRIKNVPTILLVNSLWDPATSADWANSVKVQIPNSVLILRNGGGHTSYNTFKKTSAAMDNFLVNGVIPPQGTTYES
jgi:pimeloyl-ACP methyl ester carboxylesterase